MEFENIELINSLNLRIKNHKKSGEDIADIIQNIKKLVMQNKLSEEDANGLLLLIEDINLSDIDDGEGNPKQEGFCSSLKNEKNSSLKIQDEFADIFETGPSSVDTTENDGFLNGFGNSNEDSIPNPIDDFMNFE